MTDRILLLSEEGVEQRRGFLKNLIAAPVAALATHKLILPVQAKIVTPDDAALRLKQHMAGVEAAMRDLFPGAEVRDGKTAFRITQISERDSKEGSAGHGPLLAATRACR